MPSCLAYPILYICRICVGSFAAVLIIACLLISFYRFHLSVLPCQNHSKSYLVIQRISFAFQLSVICKSDNQAFNAFMQAACKNIEWEKGKDTIQNLATRDILVNHALSA